MSSLYLVFADAIKYEKQQKVHTDSVTSNAHLIKYPLRITNELISTSTTRTRLTPSKHGRSL